MSVGTILLGHQLRLLMLMTARNIRIATAFVCRIPDLRQWCSTKCISLIPWLKTSAVISAEMWFGDVCCQHIENRGELSIQRSNTMAMTGLTTTGPLVHWLVHKLENVSPGANPSAVMTKVFLNCCFMPVMFSAALGSTSLLEGKGISGACRKVGFFF